MHHVSHTVMVFAIVGVVLLIFPGQWFARMSSRYGDPRGNRIYRRRAAVFRSAGVSLLIVAAISYLFG